MEGSKNSPYHVLKSLLEADVAAVDAIIYSLAKSHVQLIPAIVNHLLNSGGKRIRPLLTLASAKLIGCTHTAVASLAAAVELIHTATLFHDDVIDESNLRRGKETARSIWGNKASILVGDFLLGHAFRLMVDSQNVNALGMLAQTSIILTEAEVWQLDLIGKLIQEKEDYMRLILGKTASLFATSCSVVGVLHGAPQHIIDALHEYGINLGILFQITDDMLDYSAAEDALGKKLGSDFLEKKVTLPLILLLAVASEEDTNYIMEAFNSISPDVTRIIEMIARYDVGTQVLKYAQIYQTKAKEALEPFPDSVVRKQLLELVDYVAERQW